MPTFGALTPMTGRCWDCSCTASWEDCVRELNGMNRFWICRFKTNMGGCWFDFDLFCWLKISENTNIEPLSSPQSARGLIFSECQHLLKVLGSEERSTERGWGNKDWVLGYSLWRQDTNTLQKSSKPISSLSLVCHRSRRVVPGPMQTCTAWPTS